MPSFSVIPATSVAPSTVATTAPMAAPASSAVSSGGLLVSSFSFHTASGATASSSTGFLSLTKGSTPAPSSQAQPSATVPALGVGTSAPALPLSALRFPPINFLKSKSSLSFETLSDDEREENELDLTFPEVVTKYKSTAEIVNKALPLVISECKPKAKIVDLCEKGDSYISEQTDTMDKYVKKKIERGVALPTCVSANNTVCHLSHLTSDESVLEECDILKIDLGCHIDGFLAIVAHTHILQAGPITGRAADVIVAANTAAEVASRLVRPGRKNTDVTEAIQKVVVVLSPPPNVIVSMLGSPSSTFAYTILPSHWLSLLPNSTNYNDGLPHLNGCNDLDKSVPGMGFSLTHLEANLQLMHLRMFSFLYTMKTGPEVFNSWNDCSENWRVLFCWLTFDAFFNDSSGWFRKFLVGKLEKGILNVANLFEEMLKQWSEATMGIFFGFICSRKDHVESNFGALDVDLHALFIHLCTLMREFRPGWELGDWLAKTRMEKLCFQSQSNHFDDHPQFLIPLLHPINLAVHPTCLPQVILATGVTRTIIRLLEKSANLKLLTDGNFRQEDETFAGVSLCSMDIFLRLIGKAPKWVFTGRGSMIGSTIWHNNLTLMANGIFSPLMRGLTKVISTFTLSRYTIDTMTSVCLLVSDCNTCAIQFILGNTLIVSRPRYFLEYLFTNTIGNQLLHGRKMKHTEISNDSLVLLSRWFWTSIIIASMLIQRSVLSSNFFVVVFYQDHVIGRAVPDSMVTVKTTAGHPRVAGTPTRADHVYAGIDAKANQIQVFMVLLYYLFHCIIHHDPKLEPFRHSRDEKTLEAIEFGLHACFVQQNKQLITVVEDTCCLAPWIIQSSHDTRAYMYCVGLTNIVEKLRCGEHIWHVDCKDLLQSYCKLIIIPMATYLNAKSDLESIVPPFVTSVCGQYEFESYFPEYLHFFKALVDLHFQWYHVCATVVSMSIVLTAPRALTVLSKESESVFCQVFSGFIPLGSLAFTLVNDSQQLEFNVKVEKLLENQISLFTDYTSELSWIMVATRKFLTWHHSVSFSVFHQWPAISNSSRSFGSLGLLFDKNWLYYMLVGMVVYLETRTAFVLVASIMVIFGDLMAHSWENKQRQTSTCQLAGLLGVGVTWKEAEHIQSKLATTIFAA
ncbi:hypothetical protein C1H46_041498 [Malus baccata]|uniref:Peptidase M24 domain-containing protein n=1 Tax=Malus baccata TaxID=106549 RepID=A0A540KFI0_MALBA|nr:hypothetical protein C1H46_041498 [Malus baccata]